MTDADRIANLAFQIMQQVYPDQFARCLAEARAQIAEEELATLKENTSKKEKAS